MKVLVISVLMLVTLFSGAHAHGVYSVIDAQRVLMFLRSQYIEEAGLLRAAVRAYPDNMTIYVANDNVLAARALMVLGDMDISRRILTKLNSEYGGGFNNRIEVLFGVDIPDVFYTVKYEYIGEVNGYVILYEKPGDRTIENWYEYADLVVYRALNRLLRGSRPHAELLFSNLTRMWDGYGFRDEAYEGFSSDAGLYRLTSLPHPRSPALVLGLHHPWGRSGRPLAPHILDVSGRAAIYTI